MDRNDRRNQIVPRNVAQGRMSTKKLRRYSKVQIVTVSMDKVYAIARKLRDDEHSVSDKDKNYLELHLSAFKISIVDFMIVLKESNHNVEAAFDKIKADQELRELKQYLRRKSCELHQSLDINSSYIHDMAEQSKALFPNYWWNIVFKDNIMSHFL